MATCCRSAATLSSTRAPQLRSAAVCPYCTPHAVSNPLRASNFSARACASPSRRGATRKMAAAPCSSAARHPPRAKGQQSPAATLRPLPADQPAAFVNLPSVSSWNRADAPSGILTPRRSRLRSSASLPPGAVGRCSPVPAPRGRVSALAAFFFDALPCPLPASSAAPSLRTCNFEPDPTQKTAQMVIVLARFSFFFGGLHNFYAAQPQGLSAALHPRGHVRFRWNQLPWSVPA